MINIKVGESVPIEERKTDAGLLIQTQAGPAQEYKAPEGNIVRIRTRFADNQAINFDEQAAGIEKAIQSLIKLSKALNYTARHVLDEIDVAVKVEKEEEAAFLVIEMVVHHPHHYENIFNIVEGMRDKENDERVQLKLETNFEGAFTDDYDKNGTPKILYLINTKLHSATRDTIKESILKYSKDAGIDDLISRIIYFLSLKKLNLEVDIEFDLWSLIPKEFRPLKVAGVDSSILDNGMQIPLSTSMKKIAVIFKDNMVADCEISAKIAGLEARVWVKYPELYTTILHRFVSL